MSIIANLFEDPRKDPVAAFLLQVFITLILSKIFTKLLSFIHQPAVIGQIVAGIVLGPSVLGFVPGFSSFVFDTHTIASFQLVSSLGLIFFMFYLGLKMNPNEIRQGWQRTLPVALVSIIVPVSIGCVTSLWLYAMVPPNVSKASFILFVGVLTISVAAIEDIVVWVILAVATAFSKGGPAIQGLYTLLLACAFILIMLVIVRPLLSLLHVYYLRRNDECNIYFIVVCLLLLVIASLATEVINIHAFFGAFIAGLVIPRHQQKGTIHEFLAVRIELFIIEFFLPLYFTNSGLKTHLYMLSAGRACDKKKESWSFALTVGILMNTRGIVQLAVLNIGVELGVLSPVIFAIFVVAAVIMTFATSPLVYLYLVYTRHKPPKKQQFIEVKKSKNPVQKRYYLETHSTNDQQLKPFRKLRLELPSPLSNNAIPIHARNFPKFMNTNR
ncbi:unnamed protein product [Rotaria socialis]|uniref:Cation/H+ exchanger transmembrane domain-containing protein n=1 Tax=Rotaria socialis TaxID=392032 RepID=A0A820VJL6_9BILA|nr:unnamed protein product [Rotaria socialis]CAF4454148.1 unnamed protein product [Rotaria socialis]CAF4500895.1 unnamed protein product [Rotaria socialis]CAF4685933.1 unnamed protein product [Rotaria socialis]